MTLLPGVYQAKQSNGQLYFRASITYRNKHISLGSFDTEENAHQAYIEASTVLQETHLCIEDYSIEHSLSFFKWVSLINFRDNHLYCKTPIYIKSNYFLYYFTKDLQLKFDVDDLFYYSKHKIQKRGGHLFVSDFGMQTNILSRYGIKNFAVAGRDYRFVNGDTTDYRYGNIEIINKYHGVFKKIQRGLPIYITKIHIKGDFIVGTYSTEIEAAVAYNKAAKILQEKGVHKDFPLNYIVELNEIEYASVYHKLRIAKKIRNYKPS